MKLAWVAIAPWDKSLAIAALEAGADAVVLDAGDSGRMRELGLMRTVAPDGDLKLGAEVARIAIAGKEDELRVAALSPEVTVILGLDDWRVIPLENLLAQRGRLMVEVSDAAGARTALQTLERGADGIVITTRDAATARKLVALAHEESASLRLEAARVVEVKPLGMGDRVCIDTTTQMGFGEGMLVGNTTGGFLLVHAESIDNPYVAARPFRVNAGAVHAYLVAPGDRTRYLSELVAGDEVLVVNYEGRTQAAYVGRVKSERRPLLLVRATVDGQEIGLVLQNAETIRLTRPNGEALSVAALKLGDEALAYRMGGGRHFGMRVEETIRER